MSEATPPGSGRRLLVTGGSGFIGTHLVAAALDAGDTVLNLDPSPPLDREQLTRWSPVDVLDEPAIVGELRAFAPTHVVHLAAQVSVEPALTMADYRANTTGLANVLTAIEGGDTVQHLVSASTQFVCRPGYEPADDLDVDPHTTYGASKVAGENLLRRRGAGDARWTIVRPTTVWGPWDDRYRSNFYALLRRGLYVHPDVPPCYRSYAYVGNVAWQVLRILEVGDAAHGRTLYVGDRPIDLREYADEFVRAVHGRPTRTIPAGLARVLARSGDVLGKVGLPAPLTSGRLESMTTDYPVPIEPTFELLGEPPHSLADGVARTVEWLRTHRWAS